MRMLATLREIAAQNGGIIEIKTAYRYGITRALLSKYYNEKLLLRVTRGQYIFPDAAPDKLLSLANCSPMLVFSHETALFLSGIMKEMPVPPSVTFPIGAKPPTYAKRECVVYTAKQATFELGRISVKTPFGNDVYSYDIERTICDIVRAKSQVDIETRLIAIRAYAAAPRADFNKLKDYASRLRVTRLVREYLGPVL